ncbi:hypothetical protein SLEP1_g25196 [Rubroshorea leprosula]|uniref:Uncharacterized protein n=1 Tax=Rubroshorea leprosula TaxID=152421 RepID=A0AAV5JNH7_9ROSI|nr:hypothetical protein SLEP1_g25196 [Rubroshorea leprosula]
MLYRFGQVSKPVRTGHTGRYGTGLTSLLSTLHKPSSKTHFLFQLTCLFYRLSISFHLLNFNYAKEVFGLIPKRVFSLSFVQFCFCRFPTIYPNS